MKFGGDVLGRGDEAAYDCQPNDGEQLASTCSINDEEKMTTSLDTTCGGEGFHAEVASACGFPEGVFT